MAVRSKVGLVKDGWMPGKPKKTRQGQGKNCLLYTSPSPRDVEESRMPSSA